MIFPLDCEWGRGTLCLAFPTAMLLLASFGFDPRSPVFTSNVRLRVGWQETCKEENSKGYESRDPDYGDRQRFAVPQSLKPTIEIIEKQSRFSAEALQFAPVHFGAAQRYRIGLAVHYDDFRAFIALRIFAGRRIDQESAAQADHRDDDGAKVEASLH